MLCFILLLQEETAAAQAKAAEVQRNHIFIVRSMAGSNMNICNTTTGRAFTWGRGASANTHAPHTHTMKLFFALLLYQTFCLFFSPFLNR